MTVSIIRENEIQEVSDLIVRTTQICFADYYPQSVINKVCESLNYEGVKRRASWTHFYVIKEQEKIVACGAIGPYWDSKTESSLFSIFVAPEYQGKGYGRKIMETLENDEYFLRAKRIEIPAGLVAIPFYKKMGYEYKNGEMIFEDGHFALEKFNSNYIENN